jgi:hypothetical protein
MKYCEPFTPQEFVLLINPIRYSANDGHGEHDVVVFSAVGWCAFSAATVVTVIYCTGTVVHSGTMSGLEARTRAAPVPAFLTVHTWGDAAFGEISEPLCFSLVKRSTEL